MRSTMSGGEQQRLLWARIFLQNPEIILLNEATTSLDGSTAAKINKKADELFRGKTIIMVAYVSIAPPNRSRERCADAP